VKNFGADGASAGLTVDGTLTVAENPVVDLSNVTSATEEIVVATATAFAGVENLRNAVFVGYSGSRRPRLRVRDGKLYVTFAKGMVIIVY